MNADALGYAAACLVLATFSMRSMPALRATAIASNVAFIAYAVAAGLAPVGLLHLLLLPLNAWHLVRLANRRPPRAAPTPTHAPTAADTVRPCAWCRRPRVRRRTA